MWFRLMKEEKKQMTSKKEEWSDEAWQNWLGFWNLLLQEDMKQNPHFYKKHKNNVKQRRTSKTFK